MTKIEKYRLITNLQSVSIGAIRLEAHALLVEENPYDRGPRLRGFYTHPASPIFSLEVATFTPNFVEEPPTTWGDRVAMNRFGSLDFGDGVVVSIGTVPNEKPFDVLEIETADITNDVWAVLSEKCATYWDAPNFPHPQYTRTELVKRAIRRLHGGL